MTREPVTFSTPARGHADPRTLCLTVWLAVGLIRRGRRLAATLTLALAGWLGTASAAARRSA